MPASYTFLHASSSTLGIESMVSSHWIALASHSATYAGSSDRRTHVVTLRPNTSPSAASSRLAIMASEHSRGELLACCHSSAITGSVQKREKT